jgi:hypothetical protein
MGLGVSKSVKTVSEDRNRLSARRPLEEPTHGISVSASVTGSLGPVGLLLHGSALVANPRVHCSFSNMQ